MRRAFEREYACVATWTPWTEDQRRAVEERILKPWPEETATKHHQFFEWMVDYWLGLRDFRPEMPNVPDINHICTHIRTMRLEFEHARRQA